MSYHFWGIQEDDAPALTIRAVEASVPGGTCYALCDGAGKALPMQVRCSVDNPQIDEIGIVTATFRIDGKIVKIAA